MEIRKPVLAGSWYPGTAEACRREIEGFLDAPGMAEPADRALTGGIVPHAGWFFSGDVACNVIARVARGPAPDTVVVYGMHLRPDHPRFIMAKGGWETPLGVLRIDEDLAAALTARFDFEVETPRRFTRDNTIELQLPFVRHFFGDVRILPIGAPPAAATLELARAVAAAGAELGRSLRVLVEGRSKLDNGCGSGSLSRPGAADVNCNGGKKATAGVQWMGRTGGNKIVNFGLPTEAAPGAAQGDHNLTGQGVDVKIKRALAHSLWGEMAPGA